MTSKQFSQCLNSCLLVHCSIQCLKSSGISTFCEQNLQLVMNLHYFAKCRSQRFQSLKLLLYVPQNQQLQLDSSYYFGLFILPTLLSMFFYIVIRIIEFNFSKSFITVSLPYIEARQAATLYALFFSVRVISLWERTSIKKSIIYDLSVITTPLKVSFSSIYNFCIFSASEQLLNAFSNCLINASLSSLSKRRQQYLRQSSKKSSFSLEWICFTTLCKILSQIPVRLWFFGFGLFLLKRMRILMADIFRSESRNQRQKLKNMRIAYQVQGVYYCNFFTSFQKLTKALLWSSLSFELSYLRQFSLIYVCQYFQKQCLTWGFTCANLSTKKPCSYFCNLYMSFFV